MQLEEIFEKLVERPFEESSSAEYKEEIYHNFSEVYADEIIDILIMKFQHTLNLWDAM